jgi:hypothetical protein
VADRAASTSIRQVRHTVVAVQRPPCCSRCVQHRGTVYTIHITTSNSGGDCRRPLSLHKFTITAPSCRALLFSSSSIACTAGLLGSVHRWPCSSRSSSTRQTTYSIKLTLYRYYTARAYSNLQSACCQQVMAVHPASPRVYSVTIVHFPSCVTLSCRAKHSKHEEVDTICWQCTR